MSRPCDHTSVGILVVRDGKILLIDRKKPPFGLAAPAGHVDDHGELENSETERYEAAARAELQEETGLIAGGLTLIAEGRKNYACRRTDGDWHYWRIYRTDVTGETVFSDEETKGHVWVGKAQMERLLSGDEIHATQNGGTVGVSLEPVWQEWFREMDVIQLLT